MAIAMGAEHLKPHLFKKGFDPRRSKGRPPAPKCIPDILRLIGDEALPPELAGKLPAAIRDSATYIQALMRVTYLRALQGESWAVQFIADRTEGKVKDTLELQGGQKLVVTEEIVDATAPSATP